MLRLYTEFLLKKTRFVILNFFKILLFILILKLAGYFAKHIQERGGGGLIEPPKIFETANN